MNRDNKILDLLIRFTTWLGKEPINERQMLNEADYLLKDKPTKKIHKFLKHEQ